MTTEQPHVYYARPTKGIAGQFSIVARVGYPDEPPRDVEFFGSVYGGPVVMRSGDVETFVTNPERFGPFGAGWVRRFFEAS